MSKGSRAVIDWRLRTKQRIVESLGGKCVCCGYNKYIGALECHHVEKDKKRFTIGSVRANSVSWKVITEELRKCILVCSNCHKEIEHGIREVPNNCSRFNESFANYTITFPDNRRRDKRHKASGERLFVKRVYFPTSKMCVECSLVFIGKRNQIFCSEKCANKSRITIPPIDKDVLWKEVTQYTLESVGRKYGVTGNGIKKWLIKYDLPYKAKEIKRLMKIV